jgi:predicted hydrocarbon binding protein
MREDDLRIDEIIEFRDGQISLQGRRLVVHDLNAFAQMRNDLIVSLGPDLARRALTRFGYAEGQADAAAMQRVFQWDSLEAWLRAGARLQTLEGVAQTTIRVLKLDEGAKRLTMEIVWRDSAEAEEHLTAVGPSREPTCWVLAGYASGYASYCLGTDVYFAERKCRACGDRVCAATGKDAASWGDHARLLRPLFEAADIQGRIRSLTVELRRRTKELAAERLRREEAERAERARDFTLFEVRSAAFRRVLDVVGRIAPYETSVLITGESGAGKEVVARATKGHLWPSTAAPCPRRCSKASCSVTRREPSPAPPMTAWGCSNRPPRGRSSWTRSPT